MQNYLDPVGLGFMRVTPQCLRASSMGNMLCQRQMWNLELQLSILDPGLVCRPHFYAHMSTRSVIGGSIQSLLRKWVQTYKRPCQDPAAFEGHRGPLLLLSFFAKWDISYCSCASSTPLSAHLESWGENAAGLPPAGHLYQKFHTVGQRPERPVWGQYRWGR